MNRDMVENIKKQYPVGTKVVVDYMDDDRSIPPGTKGEVRHVDDIGTIHCIWENGRVLGLIPFVDNFHKE